MGSRVEKFVLEFFSNLGCDIVEENGIYIIGSVPEEFENSSGRKGPYKLCFFEGREGAEYMTKESSFFSEIVEYLKDSGKTTLLKIDFDVDPLEKIKNTIFLKNCEISNISKRDRNHFFSRFTFMTSFRYLNESEKVMKEIYVHNGEVIEGDLSGYRIVEGKNSEASGDHLEKDYCVAKDYLKVFLGEKTREIKKRLEVRLEEEIERIKKHYDNLIGELGGDLNERLDEIRDLELKIRSAEDGVEILRERLEKLRRGLVRIGDDESKGRILKEQEFAIRDATHKHSLNVDNSLINTTVIYYPVFCFDLFLKRDESGRIIEMVYDPLLDSVESVSCESCEKKITRLNLCSSGHISCDECFGKCGECGKLFCENCLNRSCSSCGKVLCKSCLLSCSGCRRYVCKHHLRKDGVSGEEKCVNCLRACLRCHGLSSQKYFGEALDGSKVCQKCLGAERRMGVMKKIFSED